MIQTLNEATFSLADVPGFKQKMLNWLRPFSIFCFLDNHGYDFSLHRAECVMAAGATAMVEGEDIAKADTFLQEGQWTFGHLAYSLKRTLHGLPDDKEDNIGFPPFFFFRPQVVVELTGALATVHASDPRQVFLEIDAQPLQQQSKPPALAPPLPLPRLSKEAYVQTVQSLQQHIRRGDCYEINFCQSFGAANTLLDPFACFARLQQVSPNPFAALYRLHHRYLLCASPERFLTQQKGRLYSQPIKGTSKRDHASAHNDQALKSALQQSEKERAENVMVVDLVRNDLTRVCKDASVRVDELFGVYSFPQVHQLVSTVSGEKKPGVSFSDIIRATFPMGSMTGAPKHRVLQLIDQYEPTARGLFSGALGYIRPTGDFDFNVVIRSLLYNAVLRYLSYHVGSGITVYSDAEKEWEECLLKAEGLKLALEIG